MKTHPFCGSQLSLVHWLLSLHSSGGPPTHCPLALQVSAVVHALLSLHTAPGVGVKAHPVCGLQLSLVHWLLSLQVSGAPPTHWPLALQVSAVVHALLSLHAAPGVGVKAHPVCGLQLLLVHWLLSLQIRGAPPTHWPLALQVSAVVHALLSLQAAPGVGVKAHPVCGLQLSFVHWLLSLQTRGEPA
jgi:hypothetical protein